ncbi:methionyl-tRNA formyltransferase [Candidatus Peregrinibacteria bacterium]|nr:MAG: methionyl-tRNA formyltransferase [Candidatus Peregrinibacteria bacterium]
MKIAVFGTPQLAANIFEHLRTCKDIEIVSVVTAPDAPAGRGKKLTPPAVKTWAETHSIPVFQPNKPDVATSHKLQEHGAELFLIISYGFLFSTDFLENSPPLWNLHFSLLPKFRGASPVQFAILSGEKESGITVFRITPGLDDGPILGEAVVYISEKYANEVFALMEEAGGNLLETLLQHIARGEIISEKIQNHQNASYCGKIQKNDAELFPKKETAEEALQKIRAFSVWPTAWFSLNGKRIKVLRAEHVPESTPPGTLRGFQDGCLVGFRIGSLNMLQVRPEGKREMTGAEFARGLVSR